MFIFYTMFRNNQLVVWKATSGEWERQRSRYLWIPNEKRQAKTMDVRVQFSQEQTSFLAVCQAKLAVYNTMTLNCVREVSPSQLSHFFKLYKLNREKLLYSFPSVKYVWFSAFSGM